jgi:hypothetical protein
MREADAGRPQRTEASGRARAAWRTRVRSLAAGRLVAWLLAAAGVATLGGCEALQRKLTRKPKHPPPRPSPIIQFQDYSRAMTPLERYRKHALLFDYWNDELMAALRTASVNTKRIRHTSTEALAELRMLQRLLSPEWARRLEPLVAARVRMDAQLQQGTFAPSQVNTMWRTLERQARQIHREFHWRTVEDRMSGGDAPGETETAAMEAGAAAQPR